MIKIFPSLLAADQTCLLDEVKSLEAHCDGFHLDIMDDHQAPNLALNYDAVNRLGQVTNTQLFVHLMVEHVERSLERLQLPASSIVAFHPTATKDPQKIIHEIMKRKCMPSIAHAVDSSAAEIYPLLDHVQHVLVMSVPLGFSGQEFAPEALTVVDELIVYKKTRHAPLTVAIDGAITTQNIGMLTQRGVEQFCIGSAIFGADDKQQALVLLYQAAQK